MIANHIIHVDVCIDQRHTPLRKQIKFRDII